VRTVVPGILKVRGMVHWSKTVRTERSPILMTVTPSAGRDEEDGAQPGMGRVPARRRPCGRGRRKGRSSGVSPRTGGRERSREMPKDDKLGRPVGAARRNEFYQELCLLCRCQSRSGLGPVNPLLHQKDDRLRVDPLGVRCDPGHHYVEDLKPNWEGI
jgi:hypothetical protein